MRTICRCQPSSFVELSHQQCLGTFSRWAEQSLKSNQYLSELNFCFIRTDRACLHMAHQHANILQESRYPGRRNLFSEVAGNRIRECLSCGDIKLCEVHRAGKNCPMKSAKLKRGIHVPTTLFYGVIMSLAVTDDDFPTLCFHGFHPTGGDLIHLHRFDIPFTQEAPPKREFGGGHRDW